MYFILQSDTKLVHGGLLSEPIFNKITKLPLNSSPSSLLLSAQQPRSGDSPPQLRLRPPSPSSSLSLSTHTQLDTHNPLANSLSRSLSLLSLLRSAADETSPASSARRCSGLSLRQPSSQPTLSPNNQNPTSINSALPSQHQKPKL